MTPLSPELEALLDLLEQMRARPQMTPDERDVQALSFAYGNLACSTNHKPTRLAFAKLAKDMGWSFARFAEWADSREWWDR